MNWYLKVLKQYVGFSGRARRTEFWMFWLFNIIALIVLTVIENIVGLGSFRGSSSGTGVSFSTSFGILSGLYSLAVLLPTLAVAVRRLHDTDRSGWWLLIGLIPFVGGLVLLVFYRLAGMPGPNRRGADPKGVMAAGPAYRAPLSRGRCAWGMPDSRASPPDTREPPRVAGGWDGRRPPGT